MGIKGGVDLEPPRYGATRDQSASVWPSVLRTRRAGAVAIRRRWQGVLVPKDLGRPCAIVWGYTSTDVEWNRRVMATGGGRYHMVDHGDVGGRLHGGLEAWQRLERARSV